MRLFLAGLLLLLGTLTTQAAVRIPVIISPDFFTPARIYPPKVMVSGGQYRVVARLGAKSGLFEYGSGDLPHFEGARTRHNLNHFDARLPIKNDLQRTS